MTLSQPLFREKKEAIKGSWMVVSAPKSSRNTLYANPRDIYAIRGYYPSYQEAITGGWEWYHASDSSEHFWVVETEDFHGEEKWRV